MSFDMLCNLINNNTTPYNNTNHYNNEQQHSYNDFTYNNTFHHFPPVYLTSHLLSENYPSPINKPPPTTLFLDFPKTSNQNVSNLKGVEERSLEHIPLGNEGFEEFVKENPILGHTSFNSSLMDQSHYSLDPEKLDKEKNIFFLNSSKKRKRRKREITKLQRQAANLRERKRMNKLNKAFEELWRKMPGNSYSHMTSHIKVSRVFILKSALSYIEYLLHKVND